MTIYNAPTHPVTRAHFSIPAVVAIVAAVGSFMASPGLGFFLAILAILAGGIGFLVAFAPSVRGGMVSIISVFAGIIGILAAIVRLIL